MPAIMPEAMPATASTTAATLPDAAKTRAALRDALVRGSAHYDRARILLRLIPIGPEAIADGSRPNTVRVIAALERALRSERTRGRAGHWTYSLDRHIGLVQALAAERRRLRTMPTAGPEPA